MNLSHSASRPGQRGVRHSARWASRLSLESLEQRLPLAAAGLFDCVAPLAAPAAGNSALFIDDFDVDGGPADNTFVARLTGVTINPGKTYRLVTATGWAAGRPLGDQSIQLFATSDGTIANRDFVAQNFSDLAGWNVPVQGSWVDNDVQFAADDHATFIGQELIILVTNYGGGDAGVVYWDNFRLFEDDALVFVDDVEADLAPASEAEVSDGGWELGNSTVANSGILAPGVASEIPNELGILVTPGGVEITNPDQRLAFARDPAGEYQLTTYVWNADRWETMFDGRRPLVDGPSFGLNPSEFTILTQTPDEISVEFRGTHPTRGDAFTLLVSASSEHDLFRFRLNLSLDSSLSIQAAEPQVTLWANRPVADVVVDQGPGNIWSGHDDVQWGNSFPAAYQWHGGLEGAVFLDVSDMRWMADGSLRRFHDLRVQTEVDGPQIGVGLLPRNQAGTTIAAGDMVFDFYLHATARSAEPSRLEAIDAMVDAFTPIHPATANFTTNRVAPFTLDWSTFAEGTDADLQLEGIVWDDVDPLDNRTFLAQNFSDNATWNDPPEGGWIDNSVTFSASAHPGSVGEQLVILVSNYAGGDPGVVAWDHFRVFENGALVFEDTVEAGLAPGDEVEVSDGGWQLGNSNTGNSGIVAPGETAGDFNQVAPLASPAEGNAYLFIDDFGIDGGAQDNTFVARLTGVTIESGKTYTIRAATGRINGRPLGDQSIQAFATSVYRDGPLFSEDVVPVLHVSTDTAVGSSQNPAFNRESVLEAWDFSTVNNYLAAWIAYDRLHADAARHEFVLEKAAALPLFFDPQAGIIRHGTRTPLHVGAFEMSWQNFVFHLETLKTYRALAAEDFNPAIAGRFLMAVDGLIEFAHNVDYVFPQWFDPIAKVAATQQDFPELGVVYEPWQIGTYAYLMTQAYDITRESMYLDEAQTALDRLFGGLQFTVDNAVYTIAYDDLADFPITEIFGNSWGVAASEILYGQTGDDRFLEYSDHFFNSLARMTYWYESRLGGDIKDIVLPSLGLFRNHGGAFTGSPWENSEALLPLTLHLKNRAEPHELILKLFNLQRINSFSFYPNAQPSVVLPYPGFHHSPANYLPIEDYYTSEHGGANGELGRRIYMSATAFWNYFLFEAFATTNDREVMLVNLDVVDGFEANVAAATRTYVAYNPTETVKNVDVSLRHLVEGMYTIEMISADGPVTEQTLSSGQLAAGLPVTLEPGMHLQLRMEHVDAAAMQAQLAAGQRARDRISYAYQLLQDAAGEQGVTAELLQLKETYRAALGDYGQADYEMAELLAETVVAALVGPSLPNADFDADGDVDGDDFLQWQSGFGIAIGAAHGDGDADFDGDVDGDDFLVWQTQFSPTAAVAADIVFAQDPERDPTSHADDVALPRRQGDVLRRPPRFPAVARIADVLLVAENFNSNRRTAAGASWR